MFTAIDAQAAFVLYTFFAAQTVTAAIVSRGFAGAQWLPSPETSPHTTSPT